MQFALILPLLQGTDQFIFQRRDGKAPTDANLLGLFGGGIELGETPAVAALREINEETSLGVKDGDLKFCLEADMPTKRGLARAYLFTMTAASADFEVYEGAGAEVFTVATILARTDLSPGARQLLLLLPKDSTA